MSKHFVNHNYTPEKIIHTFLCILFVLHFLTLQVMFILRHHKTSVCTKLCDNSNFQVSLFTILTWGLGITSQITTLDPT